MRMRAAFPACAGLWVSSLITVVLAAACGSPSGTGIGAGTTGTAGTGAGTTTTGAGGIGHVCHGQADCGLDQFCNVIQLPPFCGGKCDTAPSDGCQTDADCADAGTGLVCDRPCYCFQGGAQPQHRCTKGCSTAADCGPDRVCDATHRCAGAPCTQPSDCTANFTCPTGSGMSCAIKTCTKDSDCGDFCVDGRCVSALGTCELAGA